MIRPSRFQAGWALALRSVRKRRGLSSRDMAARMNLALRTYQRFESGAARLNIDYLFRFARAADADPYAILLAALLGTPLLAAASADNKLVEAMVIRLDEFHLALGDTLVEIQTHEAIAAFGDVFAELERMTRSRRARSSLWLKEAAKRVEGRLPPS